ncbi:MAG: serine/threonine protein kinase, partial [Deltaproteobacteria bacterium]|nr:serine/threonine protein kinase [Deltaproteobacteria bacterium]
IKVIHPKLASDRIAVKRFLREARLSSRLSQPNIVNVYDFGQTEDGILYIAMELLRGHTLGRELESMRPLSVRRVIAIAQQLCDALDAAHSQGIVHRDLKPNNIVILDDPPGRDLIKVLDFGLAKSLITDTSSLVTNTNAILGTPLYMPPEQIEGKPSDQRADLYSLGCILYQMLSGRPPFTGETVNVVLAAHVSDVAAPLPQTLPAPLVKMVARLMEKEPAKRLPSAREAREVMQGVLEGGYPTNEVYDTTPDVRPAMIDTGPIALAETHAATSASSPRAVAPVTTEIPQVAPGGSRLRWLAPLVVGAVASVGIMYFVMRPDGAEPPKTTPAVVPPPVSPDAPQLQPVVQIDAMPVDAAIAIDAASPDAPRANKPKQPKTVKPQPITPDAGVPAATEPTLDFIKRDAGS